MQFRIKHLLFATVAIAVGCSPPSLQETTADIRKAFMEHSELLSRMVEFVDEDKQVRGIGRYAESWQPVSSSRQTRLLKVLRDKGLPITDVMYDKTDGQLTVNVLVDGWNSKRLVYTNGSKPKEILLNCIKCPTQLFEPISDGWFIGIIDDSAIVRDE